MEARKIKKSFFENNTEVVAKNLLLKVIQV
jgi:3-methyladenine DNA glycosylase Mpg